MPGTARKAKMSRKAKLQKYSYHFSSFLSTKKGFIFTRALFCFLDKCLSIYTDSHSYIAVFILRVCFLQTLIEYYYDPHIPFSSKKLDTIVFQTLTI